MAYQLSELISAIRIRAKDYNFPESLIVEYLQSTQDEVLGRHRFSFMETTTDDTLPISSSSFQYDTDWQLTMGLKLTDPTNTSAIIVPTYLPQAKFYESYPAIGTAPAGQPSHWTDFGGVIYFNCPTNKSYGVHLRYLRKPITLVNTTDVPDVPVEFKQILIRGVLAGIEEYRDNFDIAAVHLRKVEDLAEDLLLRYGMRQTLVPAKATISRTSRN